MRFNHTLKNGVKYSGPFWDEAEIAAAVNALTSGRWLSAGENVAKFEREFSRQFDCKYSVMVNSGSSANLVMLAGLKKYYGWEDGSEIIVSPVGFPTTIAPIVQNNMKPIFLDIEWDTLNFDIFDMDVTKKTKAIFLSPVLGNPPDMDGLINLAKVYNLEIILDNCDSLGSKWKDEYLGKYAACFSTSFYPAHHITTGEGGMISCDNKELNTLFRSFSNWGRDCYCMGVGNLLKDGTCKNRFGKWLDNYDGIVDHKYIFSNMGYNLKPLDLQGAIGVEQLKKWEWIAGQRRVNYYKIAELAKKYLPVTLVKIFDDADPCWFGVPLISNKKHELVQFLEENKIQTRNYFAGNILLHPGFEHLGDYRDYPEANKVYDYVFFIGCHPAYNVNTINYIENVFRKWT
jgi:CDP-6-deoxy-D-xylo-4-hexulose-3-dehydrase